MINVRFEFPKGYETADGAAATLSASDNAASIKPRIGRAGGHVTNVVVEDGEGRSAAYALRVTSRGTFKLQPLARKWPEEGVE